MSILIDSRAGSVKLLDHIANSSPAPNLAGDFEFLGCGPDSEMLFIGGEYKRVPDALDAMTTGRLTGTQIPRMLDVYSRVYLIIEGPTRVTDSGFLEYSPYAGCWESARGREGGGWRYSEYRKRLESLSEFLGVRVYETHNIKETAKLITALADFWATPYEQHSSWRAWDRSQDPKRVLNRLVPTGELPLVQRVASEISGIGEKRSAYVAQFFPSVASMVMAQEEDWAKVRWLERLKSKTGTRAKKFSPETIAKIRSELWNSEFTPTKRKSRKEKKES